MYNIIGATRNVLLLPEKARLQSLSAGRNGRPFASSLRNLTLSAQKNRSWAGQSVQIRVCEAFRFLGEKKSNHYIVRTVFRALF